MVFCNISSELWKSWCGIGRNISAFCNVSAARDDGKGTGRDCLGAVYTGVFSSPCDRCRLATALEPNGGHRYVLRQWIEFWINRQPYADRSNTFALIKCPCIRKRKANRVNSGMLRSGIGNISFNGWSDLALASDGKCIQKWICILITEGGEMGTDNKNTCSAFLASYFSLKRWINVCLLSPRAFIPAVGLRSCRFIHTGYRRGRAGPRQASKRMKFPLVIEGGG